MSTPFPDVRTVIDALGGVDQAADYLGVGTNAVYHWIARNRLPADRYFAIRDALAPQTVPDELWAMGRKPDKRRVPDAALPQVNTLSGA